MIGAGYATYKHLQGTVKIIGGSIYPASSNSNLEAPREGAFGKQVYYTTVTLGDAPKKVGVTKLDSSCADYGIKDMQTDEEGKLYLWLPRNAEVTAVSTADGKSYVGKIVTGSGNTEGILPCAVTINVTEDSGKLTRTYANAPIDVTDLFVLDRNCGNATYHLETVEEGGTPGEGALPKGVGTITKAGILTVTKCGVFRIVVKTQGNDCFTAGTASANLIIEKGNQSAPTGITAQDESSGGKNDGKISGVTTEMEYQKEGGSEWTGITEGSLTGLAPGAYLVRYQETNLYKPGDSIRIHVASAAAIPVTKEKEKLTRTYNGSSMNVTDLFKLENRGNATYHLETVEEGGTPGEGALPKGVGTITKAGILTVTKCGVFRIVVKTPGNEYFTAGTASADLTVQKGNQSAPTGITAQGESSYGKNDGKILGVTAQMEYQKEGDSKWTVITKEDITEGTLTGLAVGAYLVRYQETELYKPGDSISVTIEASRGCTNLSESGRIASIKAQSYTGTVCTPAVVVTYKGVKLEKDADYTVSYTNNDKAGTAKVIVTGCGDYYGQLDTTFEIKARSIGKATVKVKDAVMTEEIVMVEGEVKPEISVKDGSKELEVNTDYKVTFSNNTKAGNAKYTITGEGNYTGTVKGTFIIYEKGTSLLGSDDYTCILTWDEKVLSGAGSTTPGITTTGKALKPAVKVTDKSGKEIDKKNYKVTYKNNKLPGTAEVLIVGKGEYKGTLTATFTILPQKLEDDYEIINVKEKIFTGSVAKQSVQVKQKKGKKKLKAGKDYVVSYQNAVNAGDEAKLTVTGIGSYKGTLSVNYTITPKDISKGIKVAKAEGKGSQKPEEPELKVTYGKRQLIKGRDYGVTYDSKSKPGKVVVTLTGNGNYEGTITKTIKK